MVFAVRPAKQPRGLSGDTFDLGAVRLLSGCFNTMSLRTGEILKKGPKRPTGGHTAVEYSLPDEIDQL